MLLKVSNYFFKVIKNARISIKLTILYAFMFSFVLLILNASILFGIEYYLYNQSYKQIDDVETMILNKVSLQKEHMDLSAKELILDVPAGENMSVRILQEGGKILNISSQFNYAIKAEEPYDRIKHLEEDEKHIVFKNVKFQSKYYGTTYIQIVKDMSREYNFMKILFVVMAIADSMGIIASIIVGYVVSKRLLKPIDYITNTAENISINNLHERIEVSGPDDELKRLANTFNNMIDRLQDAFNRQVQFVADASHELRTPVAVIQGYANLLDRWGKDDKAALEKSIYGIKVETTNMVNLIEKLLFLAKGDSGIQLIEKKEFWLNELIDEVVRESKLIGQNHTISNETNDKLSIIADYKMLKQMLRIFIENSIKFSPKQSTIYISSEADGNKVKISISDKGIGIPKNEISKIFDRFYIVDKSRSKENGGTGLGLSIAKWIVDMHNGTIEVESEEGKYTKIIVILNLNK